MPNRQHLRRIPFSVREEVAKQLKKMEEMAVIQPLVKPSSVSAEKGRFK